MRSVLMDNMVTCLCCLVVDLPVHFGFANQLKSVFLGLNGLEDHIKLQSFQRQNCPEPIIGLDVYILGGGNTVKVDAMLCRAAGRILCTVWGVWEPTWRVREYERCVCVWGYVS